MKIAITGYSGSGKSTLARYLGKRYQVPVLHLDKVHWLPFWKEREVQEELKIVGDFMDGHSSWIIDGNYSKLHFERRLEEADQIILMKFNRFICLHRAWLRSVRYRGRTRSDMGEGCNEKFDLEFAWWILHEGRTKKQKDRDLHIMHQYSDKVVVLKNQRQLNEFMKRKTGKA